MRLHRGLQVVVVELAIGPARYGLDLFGPRWFTAKGASGLAETLVGIRPGGLPAEAVYNFAMSRVLTSIAIQL